MKRRDFLGLSSAALAAMAMPQFAWAQEQAPKPNIIFILADDLGYGDLGCFGQKHIQTPVLDEMCRTGLKMTSHYSGATVCAPARNTLMSGQHIGRRDTIGQRPEFKPNENTLGTMLKSAGYATGVIGKWGLGGKTGQPNKQGFDYWFGFISQSRAHHYYPDYVWRNEEKVMMPDNPKTHEHYIHDMFTDEALGFIERNADQPFFLYLPYTIPHAEVLVPEDSQEPYIDKLGDPERGPIEEPYRLRGYNKPRYPRAARAGMISRMDRDIGRIRDQLKEKGIAENTLIIFTSDNGPCTAGGQDIRFFDSSGPLKGGKRTLYEGGIRVPTIAWWPAQIEAGRESDQPSIFYDWMPTFAELAGAEINWHTDGVSLVPTLTGKADQQKQHPYLYWEFETRGPGTLVAVRRGDYKLIANRGQEKIGLELFNLKEDIGEKNNLAGTEPHIVKDLLDIMTKWWRK